MLKGSANSVTDASRWVSRTRIARRVGSARAEKVTSREADEYLTIWLKIKHAG
jgi:hypothetical protein